MEAKSIATTKITPVIMSGGAGTRLWPASRGNHPKQLLALLGQQTLIQQTALRLQGDGRDYCFTAPLVACNQGQIEEIIRQLASVNIEANYITEPCPRNTAPCAVMAALAVKSKAPDALILLAPADHFIRNEVGFHKVISRSLSAAKSGHIVTFGITPTAPETGYGYIEAGDVVDNFAYKVAAFHEKPDHTKALNYLTDGNYFWNAGIFLCRADILLDEMHTYRPDILASCKKAFKASPEAGKIRKLDHQLFAACPSESIDYAVMEKTKRAAVVEADIGWSDIGSWKALRDLEADREGNALKGDIMALETTNSLVYSDGPFVATLGINNLVVVVHEGQVLVADMDKVQEVKSIVEALKGRS